MIALVRTLGLALPDRGTIVLVVALVLLIASGALRDFVWSDLREGRLRLRGLSRAVRIVAWTGAVALGVLIVAVMVSKEWRALFDVTAIRNGTPGRGTLLPRPLLPVTLFLLGLAFSLILAGALHVRKPLRVAAVLVYLAVAGEFADAARGVGTADAWQRTAILVCLVAVPIFYALRWRARPRPFLEFCVCFVLVTTTMALCQEQILQVEHQFGGVSLAFSEVANIVIEILVLALPFLFFVGIDIAEFGFRASEWTVEIARSKIVRWAPLALLAAGSALRLWTITSQTRERFDSHTAGSVLLAYLGALGVVVIVAVVWWTVTHVRGRDVADAEALPEEARRIGVPLVLLFFAPPLLTQLLVLLTRTALTANLPFVSEHTAASALDLANWTNDHSVQYRAIAGLACLALAWWFARQDRRAASLFVATVGGIVLWTYVTSDGRWLEGLGQWQLEHQYLDAIILVAIAGVALYWAVTGALTPVRVNGLAFLFMVSWLLAHLDFLSDPLGTQFAVAGVFIVAFGIVFDILTVGSWANVDTPALPRTSRVLVYLGYVLFSLVLVNWGLATHDLAQQHLVTGLGAELGFQLMGRPMLFAVMAVVLAGLARGRDPLRREIEHTPEPAWGAPPPEPGMQPF